MDILKKKRKVVRAVFACLCRTLEEVASGERPDGKRDSRILADLDLLREEADDLKRLDEEVTDLLLRADMQEDELDNERQGADKYAHKYKTLNLLPQRHLDATIKKEDCDNSMLTVTKRKFNLPTIEWKKFGVDVKTGSHFGGNSRILTEILTSMRRTSSSIFYRQPRQTPERGKRWRAPSPHSK